MCENLVVEHLFLSHASCGGSGRCGGGSGGGESKYASNLRV